MSDEQVVKRDSTLPATVDDAVAYIRELDTKVEISSTVSYWLIGQTLTHMRETLDVEHPAQVAAHALNLSERQMRYCMAVNRAFDQDQVYRLAQARVAWTIMREMASPRLDTVRDDMIELVLAGKITCEELDTQIKRLQCSEGGVGVLDAAAACGESGAGLTDGTTRDDLRVKFKSFVRKLKSVSDRLSREAEPAVDEFMGRGGGLIDALIDPESGAQDEAMEGEVIQMIAAMRQTTACAVALLFRANMAVAAHGWPFGELDRMLEEFRVSYEDGQLREPLETADG